MENAISAPTVDPVLKAMRDEVEGVAKRILQTVGDSISDPIDAAEKIGRLALSHALLEEERNAAIQMAKFAQSGWDKAMNSLSISAGKLDTAIKVGEELRGRVEELTADRDVLQSKGKHPAPCARFCEANAFNIEIRRLESELAEARKNQKAST
jgi:hypothetical protein